MSIQVYTYITWLSYKRMCICTLYGYIYTMCLYVYMWCSFARNEIECIMHACLVHSFMHGYVGIYICMLMQRHACTNIPFPHIYTYTYTYMYVHICMLQIFYWIMKGQLQCWFYGVTVSRWDSESCDTSSNLGRT